MGGCISNQDAKRVYNERTQKRTSSNDQKFKILGQEPQNGIYYHVSKIDLKDIIQANKEQSTTTPSLVEDAEMEEIRRDTKAKIIRKGKKRVKDVQKEETDIKDKSLNTQPKIVIFKNKEIFRIQEQDNSRRIRLQSRNSLELAENSVKRPSEKYKRSNEKLKKVDEKKNSTYQTLNVPNQHKRSRIISQKGQSNSKGKKFMINQAIEDLESEDSVIQGTCIEGESKSYISLSVSGMIQNVSFTIPKKRAGPLIVSKVSYNTYAI